MILHFFKIVTNSTILLHNQKKPQQTHNQQHKKPFKEELNKKTKPQQHMTSQSKTHKKPSIE